MQSRILPFSKLDVKDRLTVEHYLSDDLTLIRELSAVSYPLKLLGELAVVKGGKRLPPNAQYTIDGSPYVRVVEIGDFEVELGNVGRSSSELHWLVERYQLRKGDIAIVIVGATIGKVAIFRSSMSPCNFNEK